MGCAGGKRPQLATKEERKPIIEEIDAERKLTRRTSRQFQERIYTRKEFQGSLIGDELIRRDEGKREHLVIITDMGQDNDDEMALLLISELSIRGEVILEGVVANLEPANRRAALARGTLDILEMKHVPVGIGSDGGSSGHTDTFSKFISEGMVGIDYFTPNWLGVEKLEKAMGTKEEDAVSEQVRIYEGQKMLANLLRRASDKSMNLVCISSLKDAAMLLRSNEALFVAKVKCVTIMGGMTLPKRTWNPPSYSSRVVDIDSWETPVHPYLHSSMPVAPLCEPQMPLEPTDAHNNVFDPEASEFFYRRCQEIGVPLVVISRFTAYACPVQRFVYDLMVRCPIPHPTVCRLQRAQRHSVELLWRNVNDGTKLPARCDKAWFCDTFCNGEGKHRTEKDSMWDLVKTFNMYDPMAILACLPWRRDLFFQPTVHIATDGTAHFNIGESQDNPGIRPDKVNDLHDFMMACWIRAAGRLWDGSAERPPELDSEQLTAALTPMMTHNSQELEQLNRNVLKLLDTEWPKLKNSSLLSTWRDRDTLMRSIGPEMVLVDPDMIGNLGRIPHSAERKTITMQTAAERAEKENMRFFIEMFSHRWHSPYAPDDRFCNKARLLCEWAKYRRSMNFRTFYWIDHACIDQSDIAPGVAMLPLYVSCCNNILCYDVPEYEKRAWCRVERLLFTAFVAPNNEFVGPDFEYRPDAEKLANAELKPVHEGKANVPDPSADDAELSFPSDNALIKQLKDLCTQHWAKCWKDGLVDIVEQKVGLKEVRNLQYGATEYRMRRFV